MTGEQWTQIEVLFDGALALPPEARAPWLADADADETVRREVAAMLAASDRAQPFLEEPAQVVAADLVAETLPAERAGQRVGPYRLLREVGRGGMGVVYLAERADGQFEQRVAVKLLRRDFRTDAFRARFLAERQLLASLDHPNVARLLDGGGTAPTPEDAEGRPYYVMEHVEGRPLDRYADEERLSVEERLRLFAAVARTVAYAHARLVVHRDLKPSNVLLTDSGGPDGGPSVKLLDFGIAKVLSDDPTEPITRTGLRLMTPGYASPEQVRGEPVTTASDVYQLGLVLYELLAGHRPYHVGARSPAEVERVVCETDPARPSTVATQTEEVPTPGGTAVIRPEAVGRARRTSPQRLQKTLRGDLDHIVMKTLRKEPARRYASAAELADEVERFLDGRPVSARPDTAGYRSRKFVGRHRWGVAAAALLLALLVGYAATVTVQRAETARERERAERYAAFLTDLVGSATPSRRPRPWPGAT